MMSGRVLKAFNEQIKEELESAYLYLSMVSYFHSVGFDGMASWMRVQTEEEVGHAMKLFDFISERGGKVELLPISTERHKRWSSPLEVFQAAYAHEQFITGKINELVKIARDENDNAAEIFLQWFVTEQVEEEANTSRVAQALERIGDSGHGLFMMDQKLGERASASGSAEGE
ncbi:MAG: ferritin [Candidatus Coatesbacteria bacterium]|nr:MAG: ferritin [Candidatus Coatesbacteria bacterium]